MVDYMSVLESFYRWFWEAHQQEHREELDDYETQHAAYEAAWDR